MRNYQKAVEIILELEKLLENKQILLDTEEDRLNDFELIDKILNDFPNETAENIKSEISKNFNINNQYITFKDKKYLLLTPSLGVIPYIFNCTKKANYLKTENLKSSDSDCVNFLNVCIDIAKNCNAKIDYKNEIIKKLLSDLANI